MVCSAEKFRFIYITALEVRHNMKMRTPIISKQAHYSLELRELREQELFRLKDREPELEKHARNLSDCHTARLLIVWVINQIVISLTDSNVK